MSNRILCSACTLAGTSLSTSIVLHWLHFRVQKLLVFYTDANTAFLGNDPNRQVCYTSHAILAPNSSSFFLLMIFLLHVFLPPKSECGVPNLFTYLQIALKIRSQKIFNYIDDGTSCKTAVCMCIIQKFTQSLNMTHSNLANSPISSMGTV